MKSRSRPCMTHQIGACTAPCVGMVEEKEYGKQIKKAKRFLEKETTSMLAKLKKEMLALAEEEKFELAARYRDNIRSIERVLEKQAVINAQATNNQDVFGYYGDERGTLIETLHIRQGRVIGQRNQFFSQINPNSDKDDIREWLPSYINQYYQENIVPDEVYLPVDMGREITKLLEEVFSHRGQKSPHVCFPTHQTGQKLIEMASKNAKSHFENKVSKSRKKREALELIAKKLHLKEPPQRIECYDISHFQGDESVGSQVVVENGVLNKNHYRRYKIKGQVGGDDYASLMEVLGRRLDHEEWDEPDLIVIDGGKGQLNAAVKTLKEKGKSYIPICGLAKERTKRNFKGEQVERTAERFYLPGRQNPVTFAEGSEAFKILIGLRDEAHRFAISFHRKLRDDKSFSSQLDSIKGLGPTLIKRLLTHFDSVKKIRESSVGELCEVQGITEKIAHKILDSLNQDDSF
jgi:excinuclease ABC subunit C